jgi:hypothetical protein
MMRVLRWIPAVRAMAVALRETSDARLEIQGENRALKAEVGRLQDEVREARDSERKAYQMLVNVDFQLKYGFAPYPDAPKLPEFKVRNDQSGPVESNVANGRDLVNEAKLEARKEIEEYLGRGASQ